MDAQQNLIDPTIPKRKHGVCHHIPTDRLNTVMDYSSARDDELMPGSAVSDVVDTSAWPR